MARTVEEARDIARSYQVGADISRAEAADLIVAEAAIGAILRHRYLAADTSHLGLAVMKAVLETIPDDDKRKKGIDRSTRKGEKLARKTLEQALGRVSSLAESRTKMADESEETAAHELESAGILPSVDDPAAETFGVAVENS